MPTATKITGFSIEFTLMKLPVPCGPSMMKQPVTR